jgi:hypothetical protein
MKQIDLLDPEHGIFGQAFGFGLGGSYWFSFSAQPGDGSDSTAVST